MRTALLLSLLTVLACGPGAAATITEKNVAFLNYPDFPDAHSSWGSIGYSSVHKKVVIGVCNHRDRLGLYEYDVRTKKLSLRGFVDELANLRDFQWQGKIHSKIAEDPDGAMYFSTDGGESREEYLMEHPHGYSGGLFFRWDPAAGRLTNAGMAMRHDSIKDVDVDRVGGLLFGLIALRTRGSAFIISTIALVLLAAELLDNWKLTGGTNGLAMSMISLEGQYAKIPYYYYLLVIMVLSIMTSYFIRHSKFGLALRAISQDET